MKLSKELIKKRLLEINSLEYRWSLYDEIDNVKSIVNDHGFYPCLPQLEKKVSIDKDIYRKTRHYQKSAILIALFEKNNEFHIWLTKRSMNVRDPGSICFPGGHRDSVNEDELMVALREADEEIGLQPHQFQYICTFASTVAYGKILVSPVVGFVDSDFKPNINTGEVTKAFSIPLTCFFQNQHLTMNYVDNTFIRNKYFSVYLPTLNSKESTPAYIRGLTALYCVMLSAIIFNNDSTMKDLLVFSPPIKDIFLYNKLMLKYGSFESKL